jgi:hypothetical protein
VEYDRDRLSWQIILGIIQVQNGSAMFFTDTLVDTLRKDYDIPVEVRKLASGKSQRDLDLVALQEAANFRKNPAWGDVRVLSQEEYNDVKADMDTASLEDKASVRLFDMQHAVWGVEDAVVDESFYNDLVMSVAAMDVYYRAKRFKMMTDNTLAWNRGTLTRKFEVILGMDDKNLELFKAKCKQHHVMLVTGHSILDRLLGVAKLSQLSAFEQAAVQEVEVDHVFHQYLEGLSASEQTSFHKTFGLKPYTGGFRMLLVLCKKAFNIDVSRGATNCKRAPWHTIHLQNTKLKALEAKYKPRYFNLGVAE